MSNGLTELSVVRSIANQPRRQLRRGVEVVGPWGSAKTLIAAQTAEALGVSLLYLTAGRLESEAAFEDLSTFAGAERCLLFPAWEVLPTDAMDPADDIVAERMNGLNRMAVALDAKDPVYVSLSVRSFLQRVINRQLLVDDTVTLSVGHEIQLDEILTRLTALGYEREMMVEQRGQMSVRGGIFDVFPISAELPFRVELFGDEIESIRQFEPETQRSVDEVAFAHILPRSEKKLLYEQAQAHALLHHVADYLPKNTLVAVDEPLAVHEEAEKLDGQFSDSPYMDTWGKTAGRLEGMYHLSLAQVAHGPKEDTVRLTVPMMSMAAWAGRPDGFWEQLGRWDQGGYTVQLYCNNTGERRRLMELLKEHGYTPGKGAFDLRIAIGQMRAGFSCETDALAVLSEREMFGRKYVRRKRRRFEAGAAITAFGDVKPSDYVVHIDHGIGRYLGLRRFENRAGDFLAIQYAGNDVMYVPVTHIDHIQKYVGGDGGTPKMDRIGGASWERTRNKVKQSVRDMTEELLKLYASRATRPGIAFSKDTHWQDEFEDAFEYEETPDQAQAIAEVKRNMEAPHPMDRLLCGDVGFGKTEVALRAAFKAVMDGKQVAVLVPTTILAVQHYNTFKERLADYPITVEMLSRFRTPKEQREVVSRLKSGEVDIVIGTHRLTSGDISFKDLGLVVIDEEQRFGVRHKERLKTLKTNVDVLSMSATPIPRTLHFSLMGARDMSIINTAPNDRLPIHTCIEVYDPALISEAIRRELAREGQVFYLHNRVQTIEQVASKIKKLVPEARVSVGHGQMHEHELEDVMGAFIRNETDVLVCTTIIGSGLDIPNANTIIVDRADQFGLSELYQLRGRVGRYKHRAFAYLLIPGDRALTEDAQRRLKALEEFSTLGAGFRVALRDLEIRGCGNILGAQQHGNIAAVGYDTYTQLIEETVAELKGEPIARRNLPPFDLALDAAIPDEYVPIESQKITLYKRIAGIQSCDEASEMRDELKDRFGDPPPPVQRLLEVMDIRAMAGELGVTKIAGSKKSLTLNFDAAYRPAPGMQDGLREILGDAVRLDWSDTPSIHYGLDGNQDPIPAVRKLLDTLIDL